MKIALPLATMVAAGCAVAASAQTMTAAPTYDAAPNKLSAADVKALFSGKHQEDGVDTTGHAWTITVTAEGATTIIAGAWTDTGRAAVRGDAVCVTWTKAWRGAEKCFHYAHHGNLLASYGPDGALNSTVSVTR